MAEGVFIAVVGPSGVGKDSVLDGAKTLLDGNKNFHFARRTISRPQEAGGEAHIAVTDAEFSVMKANGAFCLSWEAHGLHYGIPVDICDLLADGVNVVCNISRKQVSELDQRFKRCAAIEITAKEETVYQRLVARGRESAAEITKRATRDVGTQWSSKVDVFQVSNDGELADAVDEFVKQLISLSDRSVQSA